MKNCTPVVQGKGPKYIEVHLEGKQFSSNVVQKFAVDFQLEKRCIIYDQVASSHDCAINSTKVFS